jgi:exosortase A-associated hydrolase 1
MTRELPLTFSCQGDCLLGILHLPAQPAKRGVVVVVGGPQYRVGSHRQFVLFARDMAAAGIAVMRFDYRGMGDSAGEPGTPEPCEHLGPDLHAAIDEFFTQVPELHDVVIWGLCDGASAAALYAHSDPRVAGVVLMNPWVSTQPGAAKTYLKHYYTRRFFNRDLWHKVLRGEADLWASLSAFVRTVVASLRGGTPPAEATADETLADAGPTEVSSSSPIQQRMALSLSNFPGRILLILSGNDLIAAEFKDMAAASKQWRKLLRSARVTRHDFTQADHTFSRRAWRDQVTAWTRDWLKSW